MSVSAQVIGQIIADQWPYVNRTFNTHQIRTLKAITQCRTPALGASIYQCNTCGHRHVRYHSCRNRHCPQCQNTQKEQWVEAQQARLLPVTYYHLVFTIPHALNQIFLTYPRPMYAALMRVAWEVIQDFGWNNKCLGAQTGCTMVLHTWGSNLSYHPHVHCIVPGGGITVSGKWRTARGKGKFLFPVKAMSKVFRSRMVSAVRKYLEESGMSMPTDLMRQLYKQPWVVYAKPSFGGPQGVIRYLARYTHKIAITHHRILQYKDGKVTFRYTNYRQINKPKTMTLTAQEFVRRFTLHILPNRFCRIRHYGILSSSWSKKLFPNTPAEAKSWTQIWASRDCHIDSCPYCSNGQLILIEKTEPRRGPPNNIHRPISHIIS